MRERQTVADIGEFGLIERFAARLGAPPAGETWTGDDAAVLRAPGSTLLYTTDLLIEAVDFDMAYASGADIGWKAMAVNVSDIAAMGGRAQHAVVGLGLTADCPLETADGILDGLLAAASRWDVQLVGGDISSASELVLYVGLIGVAEAEPVRRSGARPGDAICVTGALGGAAGGLALLRGGAALEASAHRRLVARHLRPHARLAEGRRLAALGATAMIDVSDGLIGDLIHLLDASELGCSVVPEAVPVDPDLIPLREVLDPFEAALTGGEDFELLFTLPADTVQYARASLAEMGTPVTRIGATQEGGRRLLGEEPMGAAGEVGWDHLRTR
ncbi:MAG: thiamine-phosphate kinase [Actinomycetota bacterium]|nr:thiamine-phosphate kinase [Actinomycetota bacterium]